MPPLSYDRYGLTGNPFRDLISETLSEVEVFHVNLDVDGPLQRIKEEVLDKENRAVVAIIGAIGAGKTERLRLAEEEARRRGARAIYVNVAPQAAATWKEMADAIVKSANLGGFSRIFSAPKWLGELSKLQAAGRRSVDSKTAAHAIAAALNDKSPSFLLMNDVHNLAPQAEVDRFALFLQDLTDQLHPGVLAMLGSYPNFYLALSNSHPSVVSRISRTITLPTLSDDQAALVVAKKLLAKRIVEALDPLFPFDSEAIQVLNKAAFGNPRRLLELADHALEQGVQSRSYRIDAEVALAALEAKRRTDAAHGGPPAPTGAFGGPPSKSPPGSSASRLPPSPMAKADYVED